MSVFSFIVRICIFASSIVLVLAEEYGQSFWCLGVLLLLELIDINAALRRKKP